MAGIYIHIPFCKQACHYCDFHFSTSFKYKDELISAICKEIEIRNTFFSPEDLIETIYFGGGTPSVLEAIDFENILRSLQQNFPLDNPEITIEANPDDITPQKLDEWKALGINRLSIGVQSFEDKALTFMNRCHSSSEAFKAIDLALTKGFDHLNLDLIFGIQVLNQQEFEQDINHFIDIKPSHISAYCLTIEEDTVFGRQVQKGILKDVSEEGSSKQYLFVSDRLQEAGYNHYEISNYSLPNHESKHNTSYWKGKKYLGLGPSAHSFNEKKRFFNVSNNAKYIQAINTNGDAYDSELLTLENQINEYILTRLRTAKGIDLEEYRSLFGMDKKTNLILKARELTQNDFVNLHENHISLTRKGKLLADSICESLFCEI